MPADHVPGKPRIGSFVDYYNPNVMRLIGFTEGFGKRYDGPYAALVTNNLGNGCTLMVFLPGVTPIEKTAIPHKDKAPVHVSQDGTNYPVGNNDGYWEWRSNIEAARAAKELKDEANETLGASGT